MAIWFYDKKETSIKIIIFRQKKNAPLLCQLARLAIFHRYLKRKEI